MSKTRCSAKLVRTVVYVSHKDMRKNFGLNISIFLHKEKVSVYRLCLTYLHNGENFNENLNYMYLNCLKTEIDGFCLPRL